MVRAVVLESFNQPLRVRTFPRPKRLAPGSALVRVNVAGVCGTDVHLWHGGLPVQTPLILGHEAVGAIEELGPGMTRDAIGNPIAEGDRVMWLPGVACGRCYYCVIGRENRCRNRRVYGVNYSAREAPYLFGDFAEYVYVQPQTYLFRVPDQVADIELISFGCAGPTICHGFDRVGGILPGDTVAVQGAGPVGLFAVLLAKLAGARSIVVVGAPQPRLEMARRLGADVLINIDEVTSNDERIRQVVQATDGVGADLVVEATGVPGAVSEGWQLAADGGRYLEVGQYTDRGMASVKPHDITRKHLAILGSWGQRPRDLLRYIRLIAMARQQFPLVKTVTHRFSMDKANDALVAVEKWQAVKAVILPQK